MSKRVRLLVTLGLTMLMTVVSAFPAGAGNATGLQWGDGSTPFHPILSLVDKTTGGDWANVVETVRASWDVTGDDVLDLSRTTSSTTTQSSVNSGLLCSEEWNANLETVAADEIHVCNFDFDDTGWVGLSITWFDLATGQILTVQVLLNDFYLVDSDPFWDNANARQLVACQEIGHGFGLDHQNGPKKQTCMNRMWGVGDSAFIDPNQHDFDQLDEIYGGGGGGGGGGGSGGGGPCSRPNSPAPQCQNPHTDFGTLTRVVHVIPAFAPSS